MLIGVIPTCPRLPLSSNRFSCRTTLYSNREPPLETAQELLYRDHIVRHVSRCGGPYRLTYRSDPKRHVNRCERKGKPHLLPTAQQAAGETQKAIQKEGGAAPQRVGFHRGGRTHIGLHVGSLATDIITDMGPGERDEEKHIGLHIHRAQSDM